MGTGTEDKHFGRDCEGERKLAMEDEEKNNEVGVETVCARTLGLKARGELKVPSVAAMSGSGTDLHKMSWREGSRNVKVLPSPFPGPGVIIVETTL